MKAVILQLKVQLEMEKAQSLEYLDEVNRLKLRLNNLNPDEQKIQRLLVAIQQLKNQTDNPLARIGHWILWAIFFLIALLGINLLLGYL